MLAGLYKTPMTAFNHAWMLVTFRSLHEIPTCKSRIHIIVHFLSDDCLSPQSNPVRRVITNKILSMFSCNVSDVLHRPSSALMPLTGCEKQASRSATAQCRSLLHSSVYAPSHFSSLNIKTVILCSRTMNSGPKENCYLSTQALP